MAGYLAIVARYRKGDEQHSYRSPVWKHGEEEARVHAVNEVTKHTQGMRTIGASLVSLDTIKVPEPPKI